MSLTIAYLTPRYTIGRFPREEEPAHDTRITRSIESGNDLLQSGANHMPVGVLECHQLQDRASLSTAAVLCLLQGQSHWPCGDKGGLVILRPVVASDGPISERRAGISLHRCAGAGDLNHRRGARRLDASAVGRGKSAAAAAGR